MQPWNCCRTCLSSENLSPIFTSPQYSEKYTNAVLKAFGVKVELKDNLPQEMCSACIEYINECRRYRKKAEYAQKILLNKLEDKTVGDIKIEISETEDFKLDDKKSIYIDVSDIEDFKECDDNITLDNFQYNFDEKCSTANGQVQYESTEEFVEKPLEIVFKKSIKKPLRKLKSKERKEKKEKRERVKEEIECEHCHKILTSRLSLRNHYKIHTGFDVVCEHCGKKFITRRLLLMHCRAKHGYEKTDKCSYCDYRASNAEQVKIHERIHTGEKPYVCSECGAGFHRKSSYLQHVAIHLPEKNVQCDQCPARFKSVTLMRIHKNRHRAPQYTYRCRVCDNSFARRRNVTRHIQRIHGLTPDQQHIDRLKIV